MSQGQMRISQLLGGGRHHSVEVIAMVVKKWRNSWGDKEFVTVYLTDWTTHEQLRSTEIEGSAAPPGKYTYRLDVFQPHMAVVDSDLPVGAVGSFRNIHVKLSKTGELEGCIFAGNQRWQANVSRLDEHDKRYKALMRQKRSFEKSEGQHSTSKSLSQKRKAKKDGARQERDKAEALSKAAAAEDHPKRRKISDEQPAASKETTHRLESRPLDSRPLDAPQLTEAQQVAAHNAKQLATGVRQQLERLNEFVSQALDGSVPICRDDLDRTISDFAEQITMRSAAELNEFSFPRTHTTQDLRTTVLRSLLYLEPRPGDNAAQTAMFHQQFERIGKDCLERPWTLQAAQKRKISYPQGYEPFHADSLNARVRLFDTKIRMPLLGDGPTMLCKDDRFINRRVSMTVKVVDFYPHNIHNFIQRHNRVTKGSKEHGGDRFEFWLYVRTREVLAETETGIHVQQQSAEFKVWVPNLAAEKLLGMTASDVIESAEEGLYALRSRLRELWGDLELVKQSLSAALKIHNNDAAKSANAGNGWRGNTPVQVSSPQIEIGVRRMPLEPEDHATAIRPPWSDIGPRDNTRLVLEGTEIVSG